MHKIKLYGLGGQGVVTASKVISHAVSIYEKKFSKTVPAYGHERRGAPVFSDVVIDTEPILLNSFVYEPDYVVVFDPSVVDKGVDICKGAHEHTVLVINTDKESVIEKINHVFEFNKVYYVNATQISREVIGKDIPNGAMLGALAKTGVVNLEAICSSLVETFKGKAGEQNAVAARKAFNQIEVK